MKIAALIARYLLGLIFVVFGLNGFLQFIPMPPPTGLAGQFMQVMFASHYMVIVFLCQLTGGVLLLANRYVPLALTILAPVIVNILNYHLLIAPESAAPALVVLILWLIVFWPIRKAFAGLLAPRPSSEA